MLRLEKRGKTFHVECSKAMRPFGLRGSLGTYNQDAALRILHKLDIALSEGSSSSLWRELSRSLPLGTYVRFADHVGVKQQELPTWSDLRKSFDAHLDQRIQIGKLSQQTKDRYKVTLDEFEAFLMEQRVSLLQDVSKPLVEKFKVWRIGRIKSRKQWRGGGGLVLDAAILHRVFAVAVENELLVKNPVRMEGRPGENPERGAEPFNGGQLSRLRDHAGKDLLVFLLLRWTGLRGSDAVKITWGEIDFGRKEIERVTQKRKKKVIVPIQTELLFALEAERDKRNPGPGDRVLLHPDTSKPLTRPRLYQRMLALGKRCGVPDAHPHRFRDTLAVDMLSRGGSPYDVAKVLGDTIDTIERHYTPFVPELRERVRSILETGVGLEELAAQEREAATKRATPGPQPTKQIQ